MSFFAVNVNMTFVGVVDAGNHVHQSSFSAAVFSEQSQNLAFVYGEIYVFVGNGTAKIFTYAFYFEHRCGVVHGVPPKKLYLIKID